MGEDRWEKLAAATGIVFVVLVVVGSFIAGQPPKAGDPIKKITAFAVDNRSALLLGDYLSAVGVVFALWFFGSLRSYLRSAEGGTGRLSAVAFGGGLLAGGIALAANAVGNALVVRVTNSSDPGVVGAFFDLSGALFGIIWFPVAAAAEATGIVAVRTGAFPRWFGWASIGLALPLLIAGIGSSTSAGPLAQGGIVQTIALMLFALWVLAASILLIQRVGVSPREAMG